MYIATCCSERCRCGLCAHQLYGSCPTPLMTKVMTTWYLGPELITSSETAIAVLAIVVGGRGGGRGGCQQPCSVTCAPVEQPPRMFAYISFKWRYATSCHGRLSPCHFATKIDVIAVVVAASVAAVGGFAARARNGRAVCRLRGSMTRQGDSRKSYTMMMVIQWRWL